MNPQDYSKKFHSGFVKSFGVLLKGYQGTDLDVVNGRRPRLHTLYLGREVYGT